MVFLGLGILKTRIWFHALLLHIVTNLKTKRMKLVLVFHIIFSDYQRYLWINVYLQKIILMNLAKE